MRRIFAVCATMAAFSLFGSYAVRAGGNHPPGEDDLQGTYAFTLAETCVQQDNFNVPGFDNNYRILDTGAMTYGGASSGLMVFDGRGKVSFQQAAATNIFNAPSFLAKGSIPLGFGFGPALPFSCTGSYTVGGGKMATISLDVTCTASISTSNPGNPIAPNTFITGFSSTFNMKGVLPENLSHLILTDLGNEGPQPVTIFVQNGAGQSQPNLNAQRVCTRATTLDLVSQGAGP